MLNILRGKSGFGESLINFNKEHNNYQWSFVLFV